MVAAGDRSPKSILIVDVLVGLPASLTLMSPVSPRKNVDGVLVTDTRLEGVDAAVVVLGAVADELVQPARSAPAVNVANTAEAMTRTPDFRAIRMPPV